ncbi:MAG: hypothetical protein KIT22_20745, partial [Verrucomicrobiae bacterium]|nr:hypothetical protein [Verrucomicrobiae bacterium]
LPTLLPALGAALTLVMPVNHELDSVDQVQRVADQLGKLGRYVIVRNAAHSESFALFDAAEIRSRLKNELGGREIEMPKLQDWLVEALNREGVTVTQAIKHPAFHLLDRQRLITWQKRLYAGFESARQLLLPGK